MLSLCFFALSIFLSYVLKKSFKLKNTIQVDVFDSNFEPNKFTLFIQLLHIYRTRGSIILFYFKKAMINSFQNLF